MCNVDCSSLLWFYYAKKSRCSVLDGVQHQTLVVKLVTSPAPQDRQPEGSTVKWGYKQSPAFLKALRGWREAVQPPHHTVLQLQDNTGSRLFTFHASQFSILASAPNYTFKILVFTIETQNIKRPSRRILLQIIDRFQNGA